MKYGGYILPRLVIFQCFSNDFHLYKLDRSQQPGKHAVRCCVSIDRGYPPVQSSPTRAVLSVHPDTDDVYFPGVPDCECQLRGLVLGAYRYARARHDDAVRIGSARSGLTRAPPLEEERRIERVEHRSPESPPETKNAARAVLNASRGPFVISALPSNTQQHQAC